MSNKLGILLRKEREVSGLSIELMSNKLGVNKNTLGAYERGERLPDIDFLLTFSEVVDADFFKLIELRIKEHPSTGVELLLKRLELMGSVVEDLQDAQVLEQQLKKYRVQHPTAKEGMTSIPLYDIRAAAGHGQIPLHEQMADVMHFSLEWIRNELHAIPADLYLVYVDGESMEPTLRSGDVILLDRRATKPDREGIYIMRMDGMLLVKRLQALPGATVKVSSDNPAYESFTVKLSEMEGQDFAILGRVVWSGRRM